MFNYKKALFLEAMKKRIPLTSTIEIIGECNFRCVHCYIDNKSRKDVLSFDDIKKFGDQIISMGCLYVILTGGEVLLHPEFKKIYLYFITKGVCVSIFTNGSLINDDVIKLFIHYPPKQIEITMYGASDEVYNIVTRRKTYDIVFNNILKLKNNNINVLVKMFVTKENYDDFQKIEDFVKQNKIPFKFDTMILAHPFSEEKKHQIDDEKVIELEKKKIGLISKVDEDLNNTLEKLCQNKLYQCGAGRSSCWLKSNNHLRMCNFLSCIDFDMNEVSVADAWNKMSSYIDEPIDTENKCYKCKYQSYCDYCPAKSYMSFGCTNMIFQEQIFCDVAKERYRILDVSGGDIK